VDAPHTATRRRRTVAGRAAAAARELADLAQAAATQGQLDTLLAADLEDRAIAAEATRIETDQAAAEVSVALSTAAGMAW